MEEPILLVDASIYLYRFYFGNGQVIQSFFKLLSSVRHRYKRCFVIFDGKSSFRSNIYPAYKRQRNSAPNSLYRIIPYLYRLVESMGFTSIMVSDLEADDIIAYLVLHHKIHSYVIFSGDKDLYQLLQYGKVTIKDKGRTITNSNLTQFFPVESNQIVDYLSLLGDTSDNIPGVPGIGVITATNLLRTYGSLKAIWSQLSSLSPKIRQCLLSYRNTISLNRSLIDLYFSYQKINKNIVIDIDDSIIEQIDWHGLSCTGISCQYKSLKMSKPFLDCRQNKVILFDDEARSNHEYINFFLHNRRESNYLVEDINGWHMVRDHYGTIEHQPIIPSLILTYRPDIFDVALRYYHTKEGLGFDFEDILTVLQQHVSKQEWQFYYDIEMPFRVAIHDYGKQRHAIDDMSIQHNHFILSSLLSEETQAVKNIMTLCQQKGLTNVFSLEDSQAIIQLSHEEKILWQYAPHLFPIIQGTVVMIDFNSLEAWILADMTSACHINILLDQESQLQELETRMCDLTFNYTKLGRMIHFFPCAKYNSSLSYNKTKHMIRCSKTDFMKHCIVVLHRHLSSQLTLVGNNRDCLFYLQKSSQTQDYITRCIKNRVVGYGSYLNITFISNKK